MGEKLGLGRRVMVKYLATSWIQHEGVEDVEGAESCLEGKSRLHTYS